MIPSVSSGAVHENRPARSRRIGGMLATASVSKLESVPAWQKVSTPAWNERTCPLPTVNDTARFWSVRPLKELAAEAGPARTRTPATAERTRSERMARHLSTPPGASAACRSRLP